MGLSKSANSSKNNKSYLVREEYKKEGIKVDSTFRNRMIKKEAKLEKEIQHKIDGLIGSDFQMNKHELSKVLSEYTLNDNKVEFINVDNQMNIPDYWKEIFGNDSFIDRKRILLSKWMKYVGEELSNTINYLNDYLVNIDLIKVGKEISILYTIKSYQTGDYLYYEGKNPMDTLKNMKESIKKNWEQFPSSLKNFYENLHNGFCMYSSKSLGLEYSENINCMSEFDWDNEIPYNFDNLFNFFSNGMGSYIVLDISQNIDESGVLWLKGDEPESEFNIWDLIDEWIIIAFDQ